MAHLVDTARTQAVCALVLGCLAGTTLAQANITSLGSGIPLGVSNATAGTYSISGSSGGQAALWTLNGSTLTYSLVGGNSGGRISHDGISYVGSFLNTGPQIAGNTAAGVSPPFSTSPTLVSAPIATTESVGRLWNGTAWVSMGGLPGTLSTDTAARALMVYGSGSSGGSTGNFLTPHSISANGRYVVGQGYVSSYNSSTGTTISNNTFNWRAWMYDSVSGTMTVLPTPFRTSSNTWRRRTGTAYAVSNDGLVVIGAQEHNVGTTPTADPDGSRLVAWRWNAGTSSWDMSYLPNGVNSSGFPYTISYSAGTVHANSTCTVVVTNAIDAAGSSFLGKWTWNAGTSSWDGPVALDTTPISPAASWLPLSVTSCGLPPIFTVSGISEDGNTVVGQARYSTCGSFMSGGFIWTSASNEIQDWYDYCVAIDVPGITANYGPVDDGDGNPLTGLCRLGYPTAISPDGQVVAGFQGGNQLIPGATPWALRFSGGATCVDPIVTTNPTTPNNFSACTSSVILNASATGTLPVTYQWYKNGVALVDGPTGTGSSITGATSFQCRINAPVTPADAGNYHAVISSGCSSATATTTTSVVQVDPAFPVATNDTCAGAQPVVQGTNVLTPAQSPCGSYVDDPFGSATCALNGTSKTDLWYVFTPAATGDFRVETCGANFDTVVTVYNGCGGSEVACNDNYTTGPSTGCTSTRSRIASFAMTAATPYYIRVAAPTAAFLSSTSTVNLSINPAPAAAPNDACATATPAVVGTNAYDLTEASNDWAASCNTALSRDVWFSYTQSSTGVVRFSTCGTTLNTVMSVHDNCFGIELACNDNSGLTSCTNQAVIDNFAVTGGSTYYIRVGASTATAIGAGNLTITQVGCDAIDFNNDGLFPDTADIDDFLSVFSGGPCSTGTCGDVDFNNDGLFPDTTDIDSLLSVFSGGACL